MSSLKDTEMQEDIGTILKGLKADEQKYPDFSDDYQWKVLGGNEGSRLYILYDTESSLLYLVQDIF